MTRCEQVLLLLVLKILALISLRTMCALQEGTGKVELLGVLELF